MIGAGPTAADRRIAFGRTFIMEGQNIGTMPTFPPFIDQNTGSLDYDQIRAEAFPLAGLIALFAGLALVPFIAVFLFAGNSPLGFLFTIAAQFILAIGAGVVLMYVIARAIQLAGAGETRQVME